jgi:hypothetical protein
MDFLPSLKEKHGDLADEKLVLLETQLYDILRSRICELVDGEACSYLERLPADVIGDGYLERFACPIWKDLLVAVHGAAGGVFKCPVLQRFNTQDPGTFHFHTRPKLTKAIAGALHCLPEIQRNPALREIDAIEELMTAISPVVVNWAARRCRDALNAQKFTHVTPWSPSTLKLVVSECESFDLALKQPDNGKVAGSDDTVPLILPSRVLAFNQDSISSDQDPLADWTQAICAHI